MGPESEPTETLTDAQRRELAVVHVAEDRLSDRAIAATVGIAKSTLERWKGQVTFKARVEAVRQALRAGLLEKGIADKTTRLRDLDELRRRQWEFVESRAAHERAFLEKNPTARPIPGWETGFAVRRWKVAAGRKPVEEYEPDTGLMSEMRATLKQIAQEQGDWTEKREITGKEGGPVRVNLTGLTDAELDVLDAVRHKLDTQQSGD